ncbi:MAG TPA: type IV pilus assembly protein PilM [Pseudolysinimonas sp.]|nr:type IV pilus assembly protein PilM [Pseudolysinimonas sp.]
MARVVGLDIGNGVLRGAEVKDPARARPTLVKYHEVKIPQGAVSRGEVVDREAVVAGLRQLWEQAKFSTKDVVLGMGNHRILARDHVVRADSIDRIREQLPFQVQDLLPVPVADALLDFYPVATEQTEQGPMIRGLLVAAIREAVLGNVDAVEAAGLHVAEVDLIPFALTRLLLGNHKSGMTALVDVGASTTYVVLAENGVPHFMRVIPTGGQDVTEALVAKHDISFDEAERVKRAVGVTGRAVAPEVQPLAATILSSTTDLLASVRNTISYFVGSRPGVAVQGIVFSGGGSELPGIREAFAELTHLPVTDADPSWSIIVAKSARTEDGVGWRDSQSVAVGLAVGSRA